MLKHDDILKALGQIIDPDLHQDIVSLGFVKNLEIVGDKVSFDLALTTPACPVRDEFREQAQKLVKALGASSVDVRLTTLPRKTAETPQDFETGLKDVKATIAVSSCKGGVGKSTVAAYMAMELAQRGFKVGLVDTDIYGPSVPALFGLKNTPVYLNDRQQIIPIERYGLKIMSFGLILGDSPAVMRGPIVSRYVQQVLHNTAWGELDYLFIDMPPGTGDVQLTITQSLRLSGAVIVTTRQTLSLVDVTRGILMFEKVEVPILGIVENMAYFVCDGCQKRHEIFGTSGRSTLQDRFGLSTLAEIPVLPLFTARIEGPVENEFVRQAVDNCVRELGKNRMLNKQVPDIVFEGAVTTFRWPAGEVKKVRNADLRMSCRCALCVNEMTGEKLLKPEDVRKDIAPTAVQPLGNYAVGINWNDGHSSGIYPYRQIRELPSVDA